MYIGTGKVSMISQRVCSPTHTHTQPQSTWCEMRNSFRQRHLRNACMMIMIWTAWTTCLFWAARLAKLSSHSISVTAARVQWTAWLPSMSALKNRSVMIPWIQYHIFSISMHSVRAKHFTTIVGHAPFLSLFPPPHPHPVKPWIRKYRNIAHQSRSVQWSSYSFKYEKQNCDKASSNSLPREIEDTSKRSLQFQICFPVVKIRWTDQS